MTDKMLTIKEAAKILGYEPCTLQKKCQGDPPEMPHYRIAGRPKFKLSELMRWIDRCRVAGGPRLKIAGGKNG